ncbi:hypothetical protein HMPREF1399_00016 [Helicobacter pylori GAM118Bi]|nr:hypothetical protein HMPREF1399_00016 [Helicobacter pylori GAM118Bi]
MIKGIFKINHNKRACEKHAIALKLMITKPKIQYKTRSRVSKYG